MNFELTHFPTPAALARAAADMWLKQLQDRPSGGGNYCVALAGGRIASLFFNELARSPRARETLRGSVHFFWGDERCVPPADPESNFGLARRHLFDPLSLADRQVHRIRGEGRPAEAARLAEEELREWVVKSNQRQPVLDMIFLGMGEDGHVASLFPGEPDAVVASPEVYRPVTGPKPPAHRVTLGYPTIAAARQVWVLLSGEGKDAAFAESLQPGGRTPLARITQMCRETRILTDLRLPAVPG